MAREIERFSSARRKYKYPYEDWFCGKIFSLEAGRDFHVPPESFATTLRSHASRHDFPAVVRPVRDPAHPNAGFRFVEVWGDPARSKKDGLPDHIARQL